MKAVPSLIAQKTVSNPREPIEVLGFSGRDTIFGQDALILKYEQVPSDDPWVGIPNETVEDLDDYGRVYVISNTLVIGTSTEHFLDDAVIHTYDDWEFGRISCPSLSIDHWDQWDVEEVSVTL